VIIPFLSIDTMISTNYSIARLVGKKKKKLKLKAKEKVARTLILATFIGLNSPLVKTKLDDA